MLLGFAALALFLALQEGPDAPGRLAAPQQQDARHARDIVLALEHIDRREERSGRLEGSIEEWNGLFRILARSDPRLRAEAWVDDGALVLAASVRLPPGPGPERLSLRARMPPFDGTPRLSSLRIGRLHLPPGAALRLAAALLDRQFGQGSAEAVTSTLTGLWIDGDRVGFHLVLPPGTEGQVGRELLTGAHGRPLPGRDDVDDLIAELVRRVEDGTLQRRGSFLPWLQTAVDLAIDHADPEDPEVTLLAVFLALDRMCGSGALMRLLPEPDEAGGRRIRPPSGACRGSLRDRGDLRQHFVTAATIRLLSSRGVAVTAGEAKELSDLDSSGFDFTDIAGNNSGIRFVAQLAATPPEGWPAIRALMQSEDDVMISLQGLPRALSATAFRIRFGEVDSPAFRAVIDEIEARIDRLPVHAGAPAGAQGG